MLLTVADNGAWDGAIREGTGLSIVRALVREELDGELFLVVDDGLRAEVAFQAGIAPVTASRRCPSRAVARVYPGDPTSRPMA